jgi:hypothetical protein
MVFLSNTVYINQLGSSHLAATGGLLPRSRLQALTLLTTSTVDSTERIDIHTPKVLISWCALDMEVTRGQRTCNIRMATVCRATNVSEESPQSCNQSITRACCLAYVIHSIQ